MQHRIILLNSIKAIVDEGEPKITRELAVRLVALASNEIVSKQVYTLSRIMETTSDAAGIKSQCLH